ncbi:MAG TPA: M23 family metallopeptidase [bacterium]|nr:M23 family metallopeptidase [bacterium]
MRIKIIAIIVCLFALPAWAAADLLYPLKAKPAISSGFGQYRIGHPHGGVDLWTFLKIGTPVLAADDGVIYEIRCSTVGYGRVLYHRLRDGRVAVYAHLSGFAPKIDAVAKKIQQANGRFSFSKSLTAGEVIAVQRGEVIGFAGDSGTDVAHLHFEIRDGNGPVNPLRAGFPFTDTQAPIFAALHLEPLTFDAHVDGRHAERIFPFSPTVGGAYRLPEIVIGGRVGLSVHAYDRANGTKRRLPPYDISMTIDGRPWFEHRFDRFSYNERFVSNLSYIYRLQVQRRGTFIRLFRRYERTVFHPTDRTGDLSTLAAGKHEARIVVRDEAGNQSEARFPLLVRPACRVEDTRFFANETGPHLAFTAEACRTVTLRDDDGRQLPLQVTGDNRRFGAELRDVAPGTLLRVDAVDAFGAVRRYRWRMPRTDRPPVSLVVLTDVRTDWQEDKLLVEADGGPYNGAMPTVRVVAGGREQPLPRHWLQVDNNRTTLAVPLKGVSSPLRVDLLWAENDGAPRVQRLDLPFQTADGGRRLVSDDGGATIDIPRRAFFRPLPVAVTQSTAATPTWLKAVSPLYTFSGQYTPLHNPLNLTINPAPGTSTAHTGVYLYDKGTWWHLEAGTRAKIPTLGSFALLRDIAPPQIGKFFAGKKRLKIMVSDQGSGIRESGIRVLLDGRARIFEYMPLKNQFVVEIGKKLNPGAHRLEVTVSDRAGNASTATFTFDR